MFVKLPGKFQQVSAVNEETNAGVPGLTFRFFQAASHFAPGYTLAQFEKALKKNEPFIDLTKQAPKYYR